MGNNTSSTRKSTAGSRISTGGVRRILRKETDLDEEFSDLILHEVTKQQQQQQLSQQQQQQQQQKSPQQQQQKQLDTSLPERGPAKATPKLGFHSSGSWDKIKGTKQFGAEPNIDYDDDDSNNNNANNNGFDNKRRKSSAPYKQFLNDLIEDEYNELNDGLLETDAELSRNILKDDDDDDNDKIMGDIEMEEAEEAKSSAEEDEQPPIKSVIKPIRDEMDTDDEFGTTADLSKVDFTKIVPGQNQNPPSIEHSSDESGNHSSVQLSEAKAVDKPMVQPVIQPVGVHGTQQVDQQTHLKAVGVDHHRPPSYHSGTSTPTLKSLIPVEIKWVNSTKENIQKISIIGSFSNWRDVIRLKPSSNHQDEYVTKIDLPLGVHKLLYIINNEYRVSDQLPTATDQEGIFFNWFEVLDEAHLFNHSQNQQNHIGASTDYDANIIQQETQTAGRYEVDRIKKKSTSFLTKVTKTLEQPDFEHVEYQMEDQQPAPQPPTFTDGTDGMEAVTHSVNGHQEETPTYVSYQDEKSGSFFTEMAQATINYSSEIPEMFLNYDYFKNKGADYQLPEPPQLPAHLNNVLLNKMSANQNQTHANNIPHAKRSGTHSPIANINDPFKPPQPSFHEGGNSLAGPAGHGNKRPPLRRADSSYYASNQEAYHLSIPNHVILNHLMTTSIRNDVLTVACITRYSGKFVTQIMHSPADT